MNEWLGKVKNLLIGGRNKIQLGLPASLNVREIHWAQESWEEISLCKWRYTGLLPVKALVVSLYLC